LAFHTIPGPPSFGPKVGQCVAKLKYSFLQRLCPLPPITNVENAATGRESAKSRNLLFATLAAGEPGDTVFGAPAPLGQTILKFRNARTARQLWFWGSGGTTQTNLAKCCLIKSLTSTLNPCVCEALGPV